MNPSHTLCDDAALHALQLQRLGPYGRMPALAGPWATALVANLRSYSDIPLRQPYTQQAVLASFADTPNDAVACLFLAIADACAATRPMGQDAAAWAVELTVYAALRCVDRDVWASRRVWQGDATKPGERHAAVESLPTSCCLVATVALAGLQGRTIRLGHNALPRGSVDLTDADLSTNLQDTLLARLYELLVRGNSDFQRNAYAALTADEIGVLQNKFDSFRIKKEIAAPYVRLPMLDAAMCTDVAAGIARLLNHDVLVGAAAHDDSLVLPAAVSSVANLRAKVLEIFKLLPGFVELPTPNADLAASPSPSPAPMPQPPASTVSSRFEWDVFISHASDNKALFVDPLVECLELEGLKVWYDKSKITAGQNICTAIDAGMKSSKFGVVIVSPEFVKKSWAPFERDALVGLERTDPSRRLIVIRLYVDQPAMEDFSPLLASKSPVDAASGMPAVKRALMAVLRPGAT